MRRSFELILGVALLFSGATPAMAIPEIQHWIAPSGARVYFVPTDALPIVDVQVVFDAASSRDGELHGISALTSGLLVEGAGDMDATELAEQAESIGAKLSTESLRDMATVSLRSLSEPAKLDQALAVMELVLSQPTFSQDALNRDRNAMLVALKARQQNAGSVAKDAFFRALYGEHPYAIGPEGTEEALKRITRKDVERFYRRYYVSKNATVALVGDIDRAQAEAIAQRLTGGLPKGGRPDPLPAPALPDEDELIRIEFPSTQTHVLAGHPAVKRGDPDYFALYVGNHVLGGGGFTSRLMEEVREKRGLSYSVYSAVTPMAQEGPFQLGLQTANDQAEEALSVLMDNLRRFREQGPTDEELEKAILNITGSFPLTIDSNANILSYLSVIGFYDLPLDYLSTFNDHVRAVTVAAVKDAFKRRVHPDRLVTIELGNFSDGKPDAESPLADHVRQDSPAGIR
jgi:zinc protease